MAAHARRNPWTYPHVAVDQGRRRALVRLHRLRRFDLYADHRVRATLRPSLRHPDHWALGGVRVGRRDHRLGRTDLHQLPDLGPTVPPGPRPRVPFLQVTILAGL